ncbi:hypothetical protein QL285_064011 [Trifolium repens]|nr:hypothetical protein QL285_064011 [Trifolium repens]
MSSPVKSVGRGKISLNLLSYSNKPLADGFGVTDLFSLSLTLTLLSEISRFHLATSRFDLKIIDLPSPSLA